eukprot:CAMPEP_0119300752 /NCGR_PEP_ID=MMETSP1333-20130426/2659_1 /TAXON_ID=418940 /ORGANISM="Scyphosphaera apsteinii, Strain RCC1455" /LENGTH=117 /DNA_ID=CAMNT_0007302641 /DNA_START=450 /DNA_END=802 /DNA_ORIENTATION=+
MCILTLAAPATSVPIAARISTHYLQDQQCDYECGPRAMGTFSPRAGNAPVDAATEARILIFGLQLKRRLPAELPLVRMPTAPPLLSTKQFVNSAETLRGISRVTFGEEVASAGHDRS